MSTKKANGGGNGTALVVLKPEQYPALLPEVAETIRQNLAGEEVSAADLTRIKVPSGGATSWSVPTPEGEESAKALEGVLIHVARRRAYWADPTPTGNPPDCTSADCQTGHGLPGGPCADCPLNAFGSAARADGKLGRGKACKESRLLFLLREGQSLPEVVVTPPGSLRITKQYLLKLGAPYWAVLTRLELERTQNKDGIAFAQIKPSKAGTLAPEIAGQIRHYAEQLQTVFQSVTVEAEDVEEEESQTV